MKNSGVQEIAPGIYWVGEESAEGGLQCNPYLLVDGEEAVLIDPGSVLDFGYVYDNVCSVISPEKVKYVILHHQDPDLCSSVPLFERNGFHFQIATHWRTKMLVRYYGINSDYYIVNGKQFRLTLQSGRTLSFLASPYLHFSGAIMTYDETTRTLFSSDLFGSFSNVWNLFAQDDYMEKMKAYHENYMPSNDVLRPVMETLLKIPIDRIAPQHGSIIDKNVKNHIKALRDLECGSFLRPIKKDLDGAGGYFSVCNAVIKRYVSMYGGEEVRDALGDMNAYCDESLTMETTAYSGYQLWDLLFERIYARKGLSWLLEMEPYVRNLSKQYDIPVPKTYETYLMKAELETNRLTQENETLSAAKERLEEDLLVVRDKMLKSGSTGLYNFEFFKNYLTKEMNNLITGQLDQNPALILLGLDQIERIKYKYGDSEVDEVFKTTALILENLKESNEVYFKLQGTLFACYIPHISKENASEIAETIRNTIATSSQYVEQITASVGVVSLDEVITEGATATQLGEKFYNTAIARVRIAKNKGRNLVCDTSSEEDYLNKAKYVLLVDSDETGQEVVQTFLENLDYSILTAKDGEQAQRLAEQYVPSLIISEVMLPKMDGFLLRQALLARSETKEIPFVFISNLKTDDSLRRAASMGVDHYLRKPFMLTELIGIVANIFKEEEKL